MLITNQNSVHFNLFQSASIQFSSFDLLQSIWSTWFASVYFVHSLYFDQVNPFRANLVHYAQFNAIWSILSKSVNTVYLVHLVYFRSLQSNSMYLLKKGKKKKFGLRVVPIIFNNINCNYMISFGYHNNLLKRMRI